MIYLSIYKYIYICICKYVYIYKNIIMSLCVISLIIIVVNMIENPMKPHPEFTPVVFILIHLIKHQTFPNMYICFHCTPTQ